MKAGKPQQLVFVFAFAGMVGCHPRFKDGTALAATGAPGTTAGTGSVVAPFASPPLLPGTPDIAGLVDKVNPTVVNITTIHEIRQPSPGLNWPFDFFRGPMDPRGLPRQPPRGDNIIKQRALGSGFIVDGEGHVVTNAHVVENADHVRVRLADEREIDATVVGRDKKLDLAVLEMKDAKGVQAAALGSSDALRVGQYVMAIGMQQHPERRDSETHGSDDPRDDRHPACIDRGLGASCDAMDTKVHWDQIYRSKKPAQVSWYQANAISSMRFIRRFGGRLARIVDIGAGTSELIDALLDAGYQRPIWVDLSESAAERTKARLGSRGALVNWIVADVTSAPVLPQVDLWHDRAVLHFLTEDADQQAYARLAPKAVRRDGHVVVATFAPDGPERCSGLPVRRYDGRGVASLLGPGFELLEEEREVHPTPGGLEKFGLAGAARRDRRCSCSLDKMRSRFVNTTDIKGQAPMALTMLCRHPATLKPSRNVV